jgi:hypothetical protein
MDRRRRPATALLLLLVPLAACVTSSPNPTPGGPRFDNAEVRFTAPTGWELREATLRHGRSWPLVFVANQPLHDDCTVSGSGMSCHSPIDVLGDGGALVTWEVRTCVAQGCALPAGRALTVGNRQGVLGTPPAESCGEIGATDRSAYYVTVTPQRVDILFVCARNPTAATRSALLGFLDAIVWRVP